MPSETPCLFQSRCPNNTVLVKAPKGATIFMPDQRVSHVYHLHEGIVGIFMDSGSGHLASSSPIVPPNFIGIDGFAGMYSKRTIYHVAQARAITPVVYCKVKREAVWALLDDPEARAHVFDYICGHVLLTVRLTARPYKSDTVQRVLVVIEALSRTTGQRQESGEVLISGVSQDDIAELANTTRATVTRILGELESRGLLRTDRRAILIRDLDELLSPVSL